MTAPFVILDIDDWTVVGAEGSGGDEKDWLEAPDRSRWLFKPRTEHEGWAQGEDWAEKIACELAAFLGVPAAHVELAVRDGRQGLVSLSLRPAGSELQPGGLLLAQLLSGYEPHRRDRSGHSLDNIERVLGDVAPPPQLTGMTAFEAFAGYLVMDALIANQDRHDENWAVLRPLPGTGPVTLAGSYDHGSSLGFNLTDARRTVVLARDGVPDFAARARAQRFDHAGDGLGTLVELAHRALARCSPAARDQWLRSVAAIDDAIVDETIDRIPKLSDPVRSFTRALLTTNRRRLLDEH